MKKRTGVLLLNLGTPESPSVGDVRRYLSEFLNDPRVIDIPPLPRKMLVNLVIVPFRAPKSAKIYQELWSMSGGKSPLLTYGVGLRNALQQAFSDRQEVTVELAMRYGNPSMDMVLEKMRKANYDRIVLFPLYPQYASASTGSTLDKAMKIIRRWWIIPEVSVAGQFYDHPGYIRSIVAQTSGFDLHSYDHIIFSYHGLPERQVDKVYDDNLCSDHACETEITPDNIHCYKATCYATTRLLAKELGLGKEQYTVSFQSRLNEKWLSPFSDEVVADWGKKGGKRLLVFSPSFVADCLETLVEIGVEYQEIFEENGGIQVDLVPSLNLDPMWVDTVKSLVVPHIKG